MTLADIGFIGGSGTLSATFPPEKSPYIKEIVGKNIVFNTPYGDSPPFSHMILMSGQTVLCCRMHGWRSGVSRRDASLQLFWSFRRARVSRILAEGGVGTLHEETVPGSLVIPDDYIDWSLRRDVALGDDYLLVMRDPLCPGLRSVLKDSAMAVLPDVALTEGGVYAVTDGRHFESRAEVRALAALGADVIGQSLAPEVYLAREIGACYAGIHQVVNRAEGVGRDWSHGELKDLFFRRSSALTELVLHALSSLPAESQCQCRALRKETLLREGADTSE
jgi:5'-methylthioadenosine phosphorylase